MENKLINPILRGFNPDPSIVKVEDTYYIAVSSFQWVPGIRVYASTDLANWTHKTDILTTQHDFRGNPIDCGVWAPQISFHDNQFYVVYTDVKNTTRPFKDCRNYLMTSDSIEGPWSEPIYLNGSGFDPSLFHDEDGRKYVLNVMWDYRLTTSNKANGIVLQEYDEQKQALVGEPLKIFEGTDLKKTEAPHIYKRDGYYYLVTAEGGTGEGHAVTIARAKNIEGPYELDPDYPMMTSADQPDWPFQAAGHGSLVQTEDEEWYMAHLMTRPIEGAYPILGRETSLQKVIWDEDGWLRLAHGGKLPALEVDLPSGLEKSTYQQSTDFYDDFAEPSLNKEWNALRRMPSEDWLRLDAKRKGVRIYGGESIQSAFEQHLIAIRQKDFTCEVETEITFKPTHYLQMAGLHLYLNEENYLYLYVTYDENKGKVLRLMKAVDGTFELTPDVVELADDEETQLSVNIDGLEAAFYYKEKHSDEKHQVGKSQDISFLTGGFTGNFIGIACQDMNQYKGCYADFTYFSYKGLDKK